MNSFQSIKQLLTGKTPELQALGRSFWGSAIFFLVILFLAFGWFTNQLGFYWDDWQIIFLKKTYGFEGLNHLLSVGGRPFYIWVYRLTMSLLGEKPLHWHLFALFSRWLAVISMWWALRQLWPQKIHLVTWAAALFAVYPIFTLQPLAVIFSQDFLLYTIFFVSFGSMLAAQRLRKFYWHFTVLGILTAALHIFTKEYFLGLELLRPLALWMLFAEQHQDWRRIAARVIKEYLPYLLVTVFFTIWRLFILVAPQEQNPIVLIEGLQTNPWATILQVIQVLARNFIFVNFEIWSKGITATSLEFSSSFSLITWSLILLSALFAFVFMIHVDNDETAKYQTSWSKRAMLFGLAGMVVGLIPTLLIGKDPLGGLFSNRFNLPTMFASAIFVVGLVSWITTERHRQNLLLALLLGTAIAILVRQNNDFRWAWEEQKDFYWQLAWRAPDIQPGTVIVGDGAITAFVDGYAAATAINLLYPQAVDAIPHELGYWYMDVHSFADKEADFLAGMPLYEESASDTFNGTSLKSIFVFDDEPGQCLWVLMQNDAGNHFLPRFFLNLLPVFNPDVIRPIGRDDNYPALDVFGPEPDHDWCYYYQKAELARQYGEWDKVLSIWSEAQQSNLRPNSSFELMPFIEAYAQTALWSNAFELSREMYRRNISTQSHLCNSWERFRLETEFSSEREVAFVELNEYVPCGLDE